MISKNEKKSRKIIWGRISYELDSFKGILEWKSTKLYTYDINSFFYGKN